MAARALLFEVHLIDGRYHGTGDWPPSPFRLFQALVAGAYGGRWRSEESERKDAAFRWLERLPPPHIAGPARTQARATTYYVPNNDLDAVGGDPARVSEIRAAKVVRAALFDPAKPFLYAWRFEDDDDHAQHLCALAWRLHTFGRGIDAAFASAQVVKWDEALARLAASRSAIARPAGRGGAGDLTCPADGALDSLKRRYAALAKRFELQRDDRSMLTLFRQSPKPHFRTIAYQRPPTRHLFELRASDDPTRFRSVAQERAADVAKAVRDLAADVVRNSLPDRAAEIERVIVGRDSGPADVARRARFVPLPSHGFRHADPAIRRILVEIPPDCPISAETIIWAVSGRSLPGFDLVDTETGEVIAETILTPAGDATMLAHYGIGARAARRWHTITPAALSEHRPHGRLGGGERADKERRSAAAVAQALRHAGRGWRDIDVRVQTEPFHLKGARADAFASDRFGGRLRHVEIIFPEPVRGPLVIGDGRWLGLGIMAPARQDAAPALHVFAIDPAERPPLAEHEAVVRALRRAVMARVDDQLGAARGRREPMPTFFTGHRPDGDPARDGTHDHLFFIADDVDGDARIDRVVVVSPTLADRSARESVQQKMIARHLQTLDRALAGFSVLRAGRAGLLHLQRAGEPADEDPVFGLARVWVSRMPYRPTRHPRRAVREAFEAVVIDDIFKECTRRGLPRPEIELTEVSAGPNGGNVAARALLRFAAAIRGPLLLGQDCHKGGGLFAARRWGG